MGVALPNEVSESDNLWHYTDGNALLNIVEQGKLGHTDPLSKRFRRASPPRTHDRTVGRRRSEHDDRGPRVLIEAVRRALSRADLFRVCVASFSVNGDDLSQWRGYSTHGNGYAVGFRAGDMKAWVKTKRTTGTPKQVGR